MKKVIFTAAIAFALVASAGISTAQTWGGVDRGFVLTPEISDYDDCDSCSDARS